jgi:hypothetical protein
MARASGTADWSRWTIAGPSAAADVAAFGMTTPHNFVHDQKKSTFGQFVMPTAISVARSQMACDKPANIDIG